jgi:cytochrome c-type biogenesis protein CcmE|tara:strand:- start:902 stop:1309 length:408 start_codon:yes stop_codon:yes gene_type:complete
VNKNLILVLVGIALVVYASVQIASNNTIYYYTTSEATSALDVDNSERIKLGGFVQNDSIENKGNGVTSFFITDGNEKIEIIFDGFVPELFQEEMGVILDGFFKDGVFYSDDMLVKHDNEYVSENGETYNVKTYSK